MVTTVQNPYDVNLTNKDAIATAAADKTATWTPAGYDAALGGYKGYDAISAGSTGYNWVGTDYAKYNADLAKAVNWDIDANQTTQGQLKGILASNSPLLQQAQTAALAGMNRRGLVNSSMAIGAGQDALYKSALPIAQADADVYARRGQFNADVANRVAANNQSATNQSRQFNAGNQQQSFLANQQAANRAAEFGAGAKNAASLQNAAAQNAALQFTAGAANEAEKRNQEALNASRQFFANAANMSAADYAKGVNTLMGAMLDQSLQMALKNADMANSVELQNIDRQTRLDVEKLAGEIKMTMQTEQSSGEIFSQLLKELSTTYASPDMSPAAKRAAIQDLLKNARAGLQLMGVLSDTPEIGNILKVGSSSTSSSGFSTPTAPYTSPFTTGYNGSFVGPR